MNFLNTTFKYFNLLGGFATIGALLAMAFLLLDVEGKVSTSAEKLRTFLKVSVAIWFIGVVGSIIFTLAQILDTPLSGALDITTIKSFITQITVGQYLAFEAVIALIVFVCAFQAKKILSLIALLILSIVGLIAPVFQSHAASGGSHSLVIGSLVIHVIA